MGLFYILIAFSFVTLFIINVMFLGLNISYWTTSGLQSIFSNQNFIDIIYGSTYLKWIFLVDGIWIISFLIFLFRRPSHVTISENNYLQKKSIENPKICVTLNAYNEEKAIKQVVEDFLNQKFVIQVNVIDNHSNDNTVKFAKECDANVITKEKNEGYAHSWVLGLKEALKTDANVIAISDADGTYNAYDIDKMLPYLNNCDMVVGSRMVPSLVEKESQNTAFLTWGNLFVAKLLEIKYFNLRHIGLVQFTDVGCTYRLIRRDALEKIIDKFTYPGTNELVPYANDMRIAIFTVITAMENNLKVIEVPITFKKRIGISKSGANKKGQALKFGLEFIWYILKS